MAASQFRHILSPVDFSQLSASGLRYAARLARCSGARLTVLYADLFLPPPYFTESSIENLKKQVESARLQAEAHLGRFVRDVLGNSAAGFIVDEALPADSIRQTASRIGADLIVMGPHGRSGVNRMILGSVTERVVRESRIPVLMVRERCDADHTGRVLCPIDGSPSAAHALETAKEVGACLEAQVESFEVHPDSDIAREVISRASETHAGLLVIGAEHQRFFDTTVLGVHTVRMLRHAPCAVLAVFAPE